MEDALSPAPRSARTKKKSALSRLAERKAAHHSGDSLSPPTQRPKEIQTLSNSDDSDEGIGLTRPSSFKRSAPVLVKSASPEHHKVNCSSDDEPPLLASSSSKSRLGPVESDNSDCERLGETAVQQEAMANHYQKLLNQSESDDDDDDDDDDDEDEGDDVLDAPKPSQSSPSYNNTSRMKHRDTLSSTTSSLFMSMAMKNRPGQVDVMSQQSLQSTSVLPMISTKEARNRSFLMGSMNSNGSLLGSEELKRFFPEKKMRIFIGTWNMCELKALPDSVDDFLLPETSDYIHDAYVIGTQESTDLRSEWEITLQETLGPQHVLFHSAAFGVLYLNVFIRRDLIWYCSVSEDASISTRNGPTGIKTKGGLGVCFTMFGTSFLFVNAHFTAHDGKAKERAADFKKICAGLSLPKQLPTANTSGTEDDVTARFDCVFWLGDLNFRLDKERERVDETVKGIETLEIPSYEDLIQYDELFKVRNQGLAFEKFNEGRIKFKPTYKYDVGTSDFNTKKMRIPSYTDRILYRVRKKGQISCLYYDSAHELMLSDHKPVYAMFEVDLRPGRDNVPLCGGQFKKDVWLEGNKRRATRSQGKTMTQKSSKICTIQ